MAARHSRRSWIVAVVVVVGLTTCAVLWLVHGEAWMARRSTRALLDDARTWAGAFPERVESGDRFEAVWTEWRESLGESQREDLLRGRFDRELLLETWPAEATSAAAAAHLLAAAAWYAVRPIQISLLGVEPADRERAREDIAAWADAVLRTAGGKRVLVSALTADYDVLGSASDEGTRAAGLPKLFLSMLLFSPRLEADRRAFLDTVPRATWERVFADARHADPRVRAGAWLLLVHCPESPRVERAAEVALDDVDEDVRIACAGALALRGDVRALETLATGLRHRRWEVRYWAARCLVSARDPTWASAIERACDVEEDSWLWSQLREFATVLRGEEPWGDDAETFLFGPVEGAR